MVVRGALSRIAAPLSITVALAYARVQPDAQESQHDPQGGIPLPTCASTFAPVGFGDAGDAAREPAAA